VKLYNFVGITSIHLINSFIQIDRSFIRSLSHTIIGSVPYLSDSFFSQFAHTFSCYVGHIFNLFVHPLEGRREVCIHAFIGSYTHSLIHSFVHLFLHEFVHFSFIPLVAHSYVNLFVGQVKVKLSLYLIN
jgi:hypothetical protein